MLQETVNVNTPTAPQQIENTLSEVVKIENDEPLTIEKVKHTVTTFAEEKSKNGFKQLYATLTSSKLNLLNDTIIIELNNEVQKEMLNAIKQDMLDAFRISLSNKQAQLEIIVSTIIEDVKAYKPADKFKQMAEKNPNLLELKKRFDLEIDY